MMNKALEVIEARHLFGVAPEQIEVVIHPQSVVHSMVEFCDGSVMAQLGTPDMRVPIAVGLAWPERIESGAPRLDFRTMADLSFSAPDALMRTFSRAAAKPVMRFGSPCPVTATLVL
jgi:1-deoxy-D-xylulose-5-phosphate reductoisomerase